MSSPSDSSCLVMFPNFEDVICLEFICKLIQKLHVLFYEPISKKLYAPIALIYTFIKGYILGPNMVGAWQGSTSSRNNSNFFLRFSGSVGGSFHFEARFGTLPLNFENFVFSMGHFTYIPFSQIFFFE